MKLLIPLIITFISLSSGVLSASELVKVSRVDNRDIIQLYFSFDTAPAYSQTVNKRRVNLIFKQTQTPFNFEMLEADSNIVKILPQPKNGDFVLSLFFRYEPQYYKFSKNTDDKIVFEVLLGNQFSKSYKELADRLKGLTVLNRNSVDNTNPYLLSPYTKDWMSFFSRYESPVTLEIPIRFNLPPFPLIHLLPSRIRGDQQTISPDMLDLASRGHWSQLTRQILEKLQLEPDITQKKMLALTYGELLARSDDFDGAFKQFYLLKETFPEELIGNFAEYLLILIRAIHEDPYIADLEFKNLATKISASNPISPYLHLSQIEAALATSQYQKMNKLLLRDDIAFPETVEEIIKIRQADYWFAIKQPIKAYVAYTLLHKSALLQAHPYSMNGNCSTLYSQKKFEESSECYDLLSSLTLAKKNAGLIQYRANMARLQFQSGASLIEYFSQLESVFPDTESGYRAALKKIDLVFLQNKSRSRWALKNYETISDDSILRSTMEEALFKQALIHSMLDQNDKSVALLQKLIREFRHGNILSTAQALLIQLLPGEIKKLVDEKKYLKALVLAKQNKEFFQKNWINSKYLADIADAYSKIGINNEAQRLYLYLIEVVPVNEKEQFYLPMIKASYNHGNYSLVEDYAAQYTYNYPNGKFNDQILFYRLQALVGEERIDDALSLLPVPLLGNDRIYNLAAGLFYRTENYDRCLSVFKILVQSNSPLSQEEQIMYGESLFNTKHFEEAENIYMQITPKNPFFDQSLYRLAELQRRKGQEKNALRLFEKIVETGTSDLWKQYAQKELQFADAARM